LTDDATLGSFTARMSLKGTVQSNAKPAPRRLHVGIAYPAALSYWRVATKRVRHGQEGTS